jgi:hypothetical protein
MHDSLKDNYLEFVSFNTARMLHDLGFDWRVTYYHNTTGILYCSKLHDYNQPQDTGIRFEDEDPHAMYSAPTVALAAQWLRKVKGMIGSVRTMPDQEYIPEIFVHGYREKKFGSYEEAEVYLVDFYVKKLIDERNNVLPDRAMTESGEYLI